MSETEKTENAAPVAEQQVHPEVARVSAIVAQAAQALTQCQSLLYELPKVVAGNIQLVAELEKVKLDVVKDVQS
jgi:hypothetical protein